MKVNIYFLICNWKVIVSWLNGLDLHLRWSRNKTIWTIFHVEGTVQQGLPRSSRLDGKTFEYWLQNQNSAEKVQSTHLKGLFAWGRGAGLKPIWQNSVWTARIAGWVFPDSFMVLLGQFYEVWGLAWSEVIFVTPVIAGGSVKFLPVV